MIHHFESLPAMATVATGGVGLGGLRFHTINPKLCSSFLGKKLKIRPISESIQSRKPHCLSSKNLVVFASGGDLVSFVHDVFLGVGVGLPCTVMECGDIIYRSTLPRSNGITLTVPGVILAMGTLSYLWATPGVAPGFFDMFVLAFVERLFRPSFKKEDFVLGKKLGEGSFGAVYRASYAKNPNPREGDLVLKKATEYGAVEIWMNERVRRACSYSCADFIYGFLEVLLKLPKIAIIIPISCQRKCIYALQHVSRVQERKEVNIGSYGDMKGRPHLQI